MKIDKNKLLQDIEEMKEKLAAMEEQLNKPNEYRHFPSNGDEYYYYTSVGTLCSNTAADYELRVNVYRTEKEADNAYNKAIAIEKVKRRLLELQGDWKPDWSECAEEKLTIQYDHNKSIFIPVCWFTTQTDSLINFIKNEETALTIINEFHEELKLIFDIQ